MTFFLLMTFSFNNFFIFSLIIIFYLLDINLFFISNFNFSLLNFNLNEINFLLINNINKFHPCLFFYCFIVFFYNYLFLLNILFKNKFKFVFFFNIFNILNILKKITLISFIFLILGSW